MKPDERDSELLQDIVDAALRIQGYIDRFGDSYEAFQSDWAYQDSCMMRVIQIAESVKCLSDDFRALHAEIPWGDLIGMRNRLAHDYGSLDAEVAWETVKYDIPSLLDFCRRCLAEEFNRL